MDDLLIFFGGGFFPRPKASKVRKGDHKKHIPNRGYMTENSTRSNSDFHIIVVIPAYLNQFPTCGDDA